MPSEKCPICHIACECREQKFAEVIEAANKVINDYVTGYRIIPALRKMESAIEYFESKK